jgi:DNA-binding response OmpR family regulator
VRILIADDDAALRHALFVRLSAWGYETVLCADGLEARVLLRSGHPPPLALLDRNMPGVGGLELCREIRALPSLASMYVLILTGATPREDMMAGLDCGADEYIGKPIHWELLRVRLQIGARIVTLQQSLAQRVIELQTALDRVKVLHALLPVCSCCRRIRDDHDYRQQLQRYAETRTDLPLSDGVCPPCVERAERQLGLRANGAPAG